MESSSEYELAFDGAEYLFEAGYWVKIEVKRTAPTAQRPHGLSYSLTLHDPEGVRLLGFDNAHGLRCGAAATGQGPSRTITGIGPRPTKADPMSSVRRCDWCRTFWTRWSASLASAASRRR